MRPQAGTRFPFSAVAPAAVAAAALASRRDLGLPGGRGCGDGNDRGGARGGAAAAAARRSRASAASTSPAPPWTPRRRWRRDGRRSAWRCVALRRASRAPSPRASRGWGFGKRTLAASRRVGGVRGGSATACRARATFPRPAIAPTGDAWSRRWCARSRRTPSARARATRPTRPPPPGARRRRRRPRRRRRLLPAEASGLRRALAAPAAVARRAARRRRRGGAPREHVGVGGRGRGEPRSRRGGARVRGFGSARSRASGTVGWDSGRRTRADPSRRARARVVRGGSIWRCPARHPRCARKTPRRWRARRSRRVALVAPPSTRREQVVSPSSRRLPDRFATPKTPPPPSPAPAPARATPPPRRRRRPRGARCAPSWSAPRRARGGARVRWTRRGTCSACVTSGRVAWEGTCPGWGAAPAKACLAAARRARASGCAGAASPRAAARVAATLVGARADGRRAPPPRGVGARRVCGEAGAGAEDDAADDAADPSFVDARARARFARERKRFGRGGDSNAEDAEEEASWFAPFRWRAGDAALVAASLRALVELVAPPVFDSRGEGRDGKDGPRRRGGRRRRPRAARRDPNVTRHKYLRLSVAARDGGVASSGARRDARRARLGGGRREPRATTRPRIRSGAGRSWRARAWARTPAKAAWAARRASPPRSSTRSPNPTPNPIRIPHESAPRSRSRPRRVLRPRGRHAPAGARRAPRRAVPVPARARAAGRQAAAESRGDFLRSAPAPTIRLGAGVTRRALRATLRWAYSGALPFPADVSDGLFLSRDGGDGEAADEGSARNALAKLASKCGAYELAHTTRFRRPKPGARVRRLTEALEALMTSGEGYADVLLRAETNAAGPDDRLDERSSRRFPAHRVVLCARASTSAPARPRARVPRVTTPKSARRRRTPRDAMPVVGVPVRGDGGGARRGARARRTRARRRGWTRGARAKRRKKNLRVRRVRMTTSTRKT